MLWVTSDTHFGHANIIRYCDRPFATVSEMDEALVRNWNELVAPEDTIYHIGDFMMGSGDPDLLLARLNGIKKLVTGNHDGKKTTKAKGWHSVYGPFIMLEGQVMLRHKPEPPWQARVLLHGHTHGTLPPAPGRLDVGVDCHSFKPIPLEEAVRLALG
jgi:calcineurin-like phosphoesterase family protein